MTGFDGNEEDEHQQRKVKRYNDMKQFLISRDGIDDGEMDLDEGFGQAMRNQFKEALKDEEELDDEEIEKHIEQDDYHKFKKQFNDIKPELERMKSLRRTEEEEEEEMNKFIDDINLEEKNKRNNLMGKEGKTGAAGFTNIGK